MTTKEENNAVATPSYEDLTKQLDNMLKLIEENNALKWSLTALYKEMNNWKCQADMWKANYDNEHKRAEKLYDEVEAARIKHGKWVACGSEWDTAEQKWMKKELNDDK